MRTFAEFLETLKDDKYTLVHLTSLYNLFMNTNLSTEEFRRKPEVKQHFTVSVLENPCVKLIILTKI